MQVQLSYGRTGLTVEVPEDSVVILPTELDGLPDERQAVSDALAEPLSGPSLEQLALGAKRVVVVFPDLTRPMPNRTVLPPLLGELERCGIPDRSITLLCATGTHRQATRSEMEELVGAEIVARYAIIDHNSDSPDHLSVGAVDGVEIRLLRQYVEADLRIITGFVEPHFFAGFSGGPKAVCPGLAATDTILEAHHPRRIADPRSTFVTREGNPVHDFVRSAVNLAPPDLSVDVTINRSRQVTAVFAGPMTVAHDAACAFAQISSTKIVDAPFDVVVSTNGGYPLDRNLYQAVKGMAAAERIVTDGGTIVMAAECKDGVPGGGAFAEVLMAAESAEDLINAQNGAELDRWQAQVMGRVLQRAQVWFYSDGLTRDLTEEALLRPIGNVSAAVAEALAHHGEGARVALLPEGPLTVATVTGSAQ